MLNTCRTAVSIINQCLKQLLVCCASVTDRIQVFVLVRLNVEMRNQPLDVGITIG